MHQPLGGIGGTATDIKIQAELILHMKKQMAELTAEQTGKSLEQILKDNDRDHWFTAEEALEYGFIDKMVARTSNVREQLSRSEGGLNSMNFMPGSTASNMPQSRYVMPQFEERTPYGFKRQDPYTKLFDDRVVFLGAQVDDTSADDVMAQLLVLESQDPDRDITCTSTRPVVRSPR